jgi:hypothetical protein
MVEEAVLAEDSRERSRPRGVIGVVEVEDDRNAI